MGKRIETPAWWTVYYDEAPSRRLPPEQSAFIQRESEKAREGLQTLRAQADRMMREFQSRMKMA